MNYSKYGRFGDTKIRNIDNKPAHVNRREANLLDSVGKRAEPLIKNIGAGTINPITGLREYHGDWSGEYGEFATENEAAEVYHNNASGGTHKHTGGFFGLTPDVVKYDSEGDGDYEYQATMGSGQGSVPDMMMFLGQGGTFEEWIALNQAASYNAPYEADPYMVEGVNEPQIWHQKWKDSGYDEGHNPFQSMHLSGDPELDYDTVKLLYETGDVVPYADIYGISEHELEAGTDFDFWKGESGIDPFEEEYGLYNIDMAEAGTRLDTAKSDALSTRKFGTTEAKYGVESGIRSLKQEELSKAIGSGFAAGGGFMRGIEKKRKNILGGYQQGLGDIKDIYKGALDTAQGTYDIDVAGYEETLTSGIKEAKGDYLEDWQEQLLELAG